jgi:hypothetical protein
MYITSLMMRIEIVLETPVSFMHMTRLIAREDFIEAYISVSRSPVRGQF